MSRPEREPPRAVGGQRDEAQPRTSRAETIRRRIASIGGVLATAVVLSALLLPALAVAAVVDLALLRRRLPSARLILFGVCWAWLELAGIAASGVLWLTGRRRDGDAHVALQTWWADRLMRALELTVGVRVDVAGVEAVAGPPAVVLVRHVSLADSLVTAWTLTTLAQRRLRIVLKRELLADPCLDIVGNRLPNCFLDRGAEDAAPGLAAIAELGRALGPDDVAVIFPEGTRANDAKRRRALERIAARDPERAERLSELQHVLPPRPAGTRALVDAAQPTDVVFGWHVGLEGFDTFSGALARMGRRAPRITIRFERVSADLVPDADGPEFDRWLDDRWLDLDQRVGDLLATGDD